MLIEIISVAKTNHHRWAFRYIRPTLHILLLSHQDRPHELLDDGSFQLIISVIIIINVYYFIVIIIIINAEN